MPKTPKQEQGSSSAALQPDATKVTTADTRGEGQRSPAPSAAPSLPSIELPKGGGAIRGIGEKFAVSAVTGTASLSIPLPASPGRSGFAPQLALSYDSGAGNGPFGLGWQLALPAITRKTDKGLPRYEDGEESDVFILSGSEDLVPALTHSGQGWEEERVPDQGPYAVRRYRPRIEGLFARIERLQHRETGDTYWRSVSKDNVTSVYGRDPQCQVADAGRVFSWLLEESRDDKGNVVRYTYKAEDLANVDPSLAYEQQRLGLAAPLPNRYLKRVSYSNQRPGEAEGWHFHLVFDYGEHEPLAPALDEAQSWPCRQDPFSSYRPGFELRTYRLCRRVLMFHDGFGDPGGPVLVRSTDFAYREGPAATFLSAVTQRGYIRDGAAYKAEELPPLQLAYSEARPEADVRAVDEESLENLPIGLDGVAYQWVDLDSEGAAGVLTEQAGGWFYKRNLGSAALDSTLAADVPPPPPGPAATGTVRFAPVELLATRPSLANLAGGQQQVMDLANDGHKSLVQFGDPMPGFYRRTEDGGWEPFAPFESHPNLLWNDPNLRFVDLTGDGFADILIAEDELFVWYPSRAEEGFGAPAWVHKGGDEERGPALVFADGAQSIYLADMSGDGLTDIARIRDGEVCYWPNLGYGRFGARVVMAAAPSFDHPDQFEQRRVRLADVDGSGTTDLIYLGREGVRYWINQSGNSWSDAHTVAQFPAVDNLSAVTVLDLLGAGTACLVWSSPLPGATGRSIQYIDLMGGVKPHLLTSVVNTMGAETTVAYTSSTRSYLADRAAGTPWATRLPFPVHVVERVETHDHVTGAKLVTLYRYHHGYYDGAEREFRGFGMIEQWDTETFGAFAGAGHAGAPSNATDEALHQPPAYTRSWFHTGAWQQRTTLARRFEDEYYKPGGGETAEGVLPEPPLPREVSLAEGSPVAHTLTPQEEREAFRALKGLPLRQEIYAVDGDPKSIHPYSVTSNGYTLKLLQPAAGNEHAVFYACPRETLSYHYERIAADPRIGHQLTLAVDPFGNVTRAASIGYPRRSPAHQEQGLTHVVYTETLVANRPNEDGWYRIGVPVETRTYEICGKLPQGAPLTFEAVHKLIAGASQIPYEQEPDPNSAQRRLIEHVRALYRGDDLGGPLPLGVVESLALPYESYQLAFTPGLLARLYGARVDGALLAGEGRYVHSEGDAGWWIPSGRAVYAADAPAHFYLPTGFEDPFGNTSSVTYDAYDLLAVELRDAIGNTVGARNDYRVLGPELVTDPNGNRSAATFDALGMVVATAAMGKEGAGEGDTLEDPTTRLEYSLREWADHGRPNFVHSFAREQHGPANPRWQEAYSYSGGLGQEVMRKIQAEPGPAPARGPDGALLRDGQGKLVLADTAPAVRWVGTGRTVFNNKGKPVKQYEPFFSSMPAYEDEADLVETGVTPIMHYDPLGRLVRTDHPDGTFSTVVFDPWRQATSDANDNVLDSAWYAEQQALPASDPQRRAAELAAEHAGTAALAHLDTLGRTVRTVADNGPAGKYETRVELDIEGNQRAVIDARGNRVLEQDFDMLGHALHTRSADAGERWALADVMGRPIRGWDSRGHVVRTRYDALSRPTHLFVRQGAVEFLAERTVYGEAHPDAIARNLRGRAYQHYDGAGVSTSERYDFKGNLLASSRRLAKEYKQRADWSALGELADVAAIEAAAAPLLEGEPFTASTAYDALNRPTSLVLPDGSETLPGYNEANLLERVDVRLRGAAGATPFVADIDYDAKGQRERIVYGSGVATSYEYDPRTFRLTHLQTLRGTTPLQDLRYTYDPVGNIVAIGDDAQQTVYFDNQAVTPSAQYVYDALYRLTQAEGREHAGASGNSQPQHRPKLKPHYDFNDSTRTTLPHPNDAQAMRRYGEWYQYDEVGNILRMVHHAEGGSWSRRYVYEQTSNRLRATSFPWDPEGASLPIGYRYDAHGNMTLMPHLPQLDWDFEDQLQRVDLGGGGAAYYVYDAGGQRVRKVIERLNGTRKEERVYLGGFEVYREFAGNGNDVKLERETLHMMDGTRRIALVETKTIDTQSAISNLQSAIRYQHDNHLGSASLELDAEGAVISYEEYYPYGSTSFQAGRSAAETSLKRYRYTGKERDEETGLYYHGARYYAPWLGRWTATDPIGIGDGVNVYAYVRCNPVILIDPEGTENTPASKTNKKIMQMTDAKLYNYLKGLSSTERANIISSATGAFAVRAQAMANKYHMQLLYQVEEINIEGEKTSKTTDNKRTTEAKDYTNLDYSKQNKRFPETMFSKSIIVANSEQGGLVLPVGALSPFSNVVTGYRDVPEMVDKIINATDGFCISSLDILGHGSPGSQQAGYDSANEDENAKGYISGWTVRSLDMPSDQSDVRPDLLRLSAYFCEDAVVSLHACKVAREDAGDALLENLAALMNVTVRGGEDDQTGDLPGLEGWIKVATPSTKLNEKPSITLIPPLYEQGILLHGGRLF